jgi:hypothetical protein
MLTAWSDTLDVGVGEEFDQSGRGALGARFVTGFDCDQILHKSRK